MHRTWTVALAALALAAGGCGDDEEPQRQSTSAAASTLSAAELRSQAEEICAPYVERYGRALERAGSGGVGAQRRRYARAIDRSVRVRLDIAAQLDELAPPPALRADFERFVQALRDTARGYPTFAETMRSEDPRARERDEGRREVAELGSKLRIGAVCGG